MLINSDTLNINQHQHQQYLCFFYPYFDMKSHALICEEVNSSAFRKAGGGKARQD